jgi:hypothetical protein
MLSAIIRPSQNIQQLNTSVRCAGFTVFSFTWTMAAMFHQLTFNDWRWYDPKGVILSLAILPVLYRPSSWQRFALYVFVDWLMVGLAFPEHPNHIVFSWVLNGCILVSLGLVAYRNKGVSDPEFAAIWFRAFAPWARIFLCILYWLTVFHKINTSYLNLDCSCGSGMLLDIDKRFHLPPAAPWVQYCAMYGTLLIEALLPLMLLMRQTRAIVIVPGLLFHGMLALHPHAGIFSFSATIIALYTTFLPAEVAEDLMPKKWMILSRRWVIIVLGSCVLAWIFRAWLPAVLQRDYWPWFWRVGFVTFYIYLGFCLVLYIRARLKRRAENLDIQGNLATYPVLAIFGLVLVVNGFGPYFGLRTQSSFSMFSNLHTENGVSNHLIMPASLQVTDWQKDLVEIIDTNDEELLRARDQNMLVVYLELRRVRSDRENFFAVFRRNGIVQSYYEGRPETHGSLPKMNALAKRYYFFRPVDRDPTKVTCKH